MTRRPRIALSGLVALSLIAGACASGGTAEPVDTAESAVDEPAAEEPATDGDDPAGEEPEATGDATADASALEATGLSTSTPAGTTEVDAITWALYRPTAPLDPLFVFDYPEQVPLVLMCETPLRTLPDGSIEDGLTTVEQVDDVTYILTIQEGATFWNGDPVTADDVAFSLTRRWEVPGPHWLSFRHIGAIEATDASTVTITMTEPDAFLPSLLVGTASAIVQQSFVEAAGEDFGNATGGIMCSGAYRLGNWSAGSSLVVERNEDYWRSDVRPLVRSIEFIGVEDPFAVSAGLRSGDIDGYFAFASIPTLAQLEDDPNVTVTRGAGYQFDGMLLAPREDSPLNDPRVKRALSMAIDRQGYIDAVLVGAGAVPRSVVSPGAWSYSRDVFRAGYDALPEPTVDIDGARALVQDAGAEGATIAIGYIAEVPPHAAEGALFQAAGEQIGLNVELVAFPADQYIGLFDPVDPTLRAGVDGWFTVAYPDAADPGLAITQVAEPEGNLNYGYFNEQVSDLMAQARAEFDDDARAQLIVEAQAVTVEDPPLIVVALPENVLITSSELTGAWPSFAHMFGNWAIELGGK